jgi:hypothetical protein
MMRTSQSGHWPALKQTAIVVDKRSLRSHATGNDRTSAHSHVTVSAIGKPAGGQVMSRFCCSKCGCVEDTALCRYWSARLRRKPLVCSACDPAIARWHGEFPRQSADGWVTDEHRLLIWSRGEVEDWVGTPIPILGKAATSPLAGDEHPSLPENEKAPGRLIAGA